MIFDKTPVRFQLLLALVAMASSQNEIESVRDLCTHSDDLYNYTTARNYACGCAKPDLCVRKCCKPGFYHFHEEDPYGGKCISVCTRTANITEENFTVPVYDGLRKVFELKDKFMIGMLNCHNPRWQYFKINNYDPKEKVYIQKNGSLYFPAVSRMYSMDRYCVDEEDGLTFYLCYTPGATSKVVSTLLVSTGMCVATPLLFLTFVIYAILPEKNIFMVALMNHVLSLFLAYVFLLKVQLTPYKIDEILCPLLGYMIIYFFLVSFFWMNVICLDVYFAFRDMRGYNDRKLGKSKGFLMYFTYAQGVPLLHILIVFLTDKFGDREAIYYAGVGDKKCFLNDGYPNIFYFYGPMAILMTADIILFIMTALKIKKVEKETSILKNYHSSYEENKQRFTLYMKLSVVTGINGFATNWTVELISWALDWKNTGNVPVYVWYILDFCNAMYGVLIFFIFVFKKKIWESLKKRYWCSRENVTSPTS